MPAARPSRPLRKRPDQYHHGDLRRALIQEAVRTIQAHGVERLTLRSVGERLGVSRTALYRHFTDKSALLAAVATEGFCTFRLQLTEAWEQGGRGREGFDAMGIAYVRFAIAHPSYYRVMFGGFVGAGAEDPQLQEEGAAAFQVLVDALVALQRQRLVVEDPPVQLAQFVWSTVHGVAMLAIDGQLQGKPAHGEDLIRYAIDRLRTGIAAPQP